jgi:DNA-binding transcriptional LysR family regulator
VSQPTITEHIKQLETGYGQRLFDRGRGTLTREGEVLRRMVESSIDRLDSLTFDEKPMEAHVGLGGPPDLLSLLALPALAPLYAEGINIRVRPGLAEDLITHLENGTLDMFIATRHIESEVVEVRYVPLFAEEYVLVGNRDWFERVCGDIDPDAADDKIERSIADGLSRAQFLAFDGDLPLIRDHPLILRHQRTIFDADRLRRVPLIMPDLRGLCEAAIAGAGVTVIPRYIVSDALRAGLLFELHEPAERKLNTLYIAHRDEPLSSVQQRLITCLCDAARGWQECPGEAPGASSKVSANGGASAPGGTGGAVTARIRKQPEDSDHA